jgi:tetratricopeptide (TPR) repeat protein
MIIASIERTERPSFRVTIVAVLALGCVAVLGVEAEPVRGDEILSQTRQMLLDGQYEECLASTLRATDEDRQRDEEWWLLRIQALEQLGRYADAAEVAEKALEGEDYYALRFSLPLRLAAHRLHRLLGQPDKARERASQIGSLARQTPYQYAQASNLVTIGRWALMIGEDPKQVLEVFFERAMTQRPDYRDGYLAAGELALSKGDYAEAGRVYQKAIERFPDDPDMQFGLARAFAPDDWSKAAPCLERALEINPRHAESRLLLVDRAIDAEQYEEARRLLDEIESTNPHRPEMWAYRAVIAHLNGQWDQERAAYDKAKSHWANDPDVDHLVGKKLSQHYRFAVGAEFQRRALASDPQHLVAKLQLAQDLLRLGKVEEGWKLATDAQQADGYNVTAFNLTTLKDTLDKFTVLEDRDFTLRMASNEAPLYGDLALELLHRAKDQLCEKYGLKLEEPVTVEIFPRQEDFAVRTFGMPGGSGYLGVCFGRVITANSPASQGDTPANWQSVLWHEFCHVVTLELTQNRMPRWLSEGISVYEERQADPRWGETMSREYREMIVDGKLTPIGRLSEAFLSPPSPMHLQFAYYESSLVVEFIVDRVGLPALQRVLLALGAGVSINDALEAHVGSLAVLEPEFEEFAREKAETFAEGIDWERPDPEQGQVDWAAWLAEHPQNYWGHIGRAAELLRAEDWAAARDLLRELIDRFPECLEAENPYSMLARAHRELGEVEEEIRVLTAYCELENNAASAYRRLAELGEERKDWELVRVNAERLLAVDPLEADPHAYMAHAAEELGDRWQAIAGYQKVLQFETGDLARVHFRLGTLMAEIANEAQNDDLRRDARRHVLLALEEAPRYREAQRLLLSLADENKPDPETIPVEAAVEETDSQARAAATEPNDVPGDAPTPTVDTEKTPEPDGEPQP